MAEAEAHRLLDKAALKRTESVCSLVRFSVLCLPGAEFIRHRSHYRHSRHCHSRAPPAAAPTTPPPVHPPDLAPPVRRGRLWPAAPALTAPPGRGRPDRAQPAGRRRQRGFRRGGRFRGVYRRMVFGFISKAACARKKQTSNSRKKLTCPKMSGTSAVCVQANAKSTEGKGAM